MGTEAGIEQPQGQAEETQQGTGPEVTEQSDAPYAQYLEQFPTSLRPTAEKVFKEWDSNTGRKFQEVHSQYEPLKAYEKFATEKIDPEALEQGYSLLQRIQADPRSVYDLLGQSFGFAGEQGQEENEPGSEEEESGDVFSDPRFAQVEQLARSAAEVLVNQRQQQEVDEADRQVQAELDAAKEKFGDYDEEYVLTKLFANPDRSVESVVQEYQQLVERALKAQKAPTAPTILGSGGGLVSEPVDVSKMTPTERKAYVVQRLAQSQQP